MASAGVSAVKIIDNDSDVVTVTSNRLDVNAYLSAGTSIDIGDVDIHLSGNVPLLGGAGSLAAGVLRVTIADDDNVSEKLTAIDTDTGNIASAIYADDAAFSLNSSKGIAIMGFAGTQSITTDEVGVLACTASGKLVVSIGHTSTSVPISGDIVLGNTYYSETITGGIMAGAVRNDILDALAGTNNECAPLQVDALGALYTSSVKGSLDTFAMIDVDNSEEVLSDTIGTITDCNEIIFQADESNSGYIMIGDADVADNRGIKLNAGDTFILEKQMTTGINLWASAANQNLRCTLMRAA